MDLLYTHIDALFRCASPEMLLHTLAQREETQTRLSAPSDREPACSTKAVDWDVYSRMVRPLLPQYTMDELFLLYRDLCGRLENAGAGIFSLLGDYAGNVLNFRPDGIFSRQEDLLAWRERSFALGQDLFTCAGLAQRDARQLCESRDFSWPSILPPDNGTVMTFLAKGYSENHFHLTGSSQIFPLAWAFLMNHPERITRYFSSQKYHENLQPTVIWSLTEENLSWPERIWCACWIRWYLFCRVGLEWSTVPDPAQPGAYGTADNAAGRLLHELSGFDKVSSLRKKVERLRCFYGAKLPQSCRVECLDYAVTAEVFLANRGPRRLLAGERFFLYKCFLGCYRNTLTNEEQELFYLYLLIKLRFRQEIVQVNGRKGFRNFSSYQDRKSLGWGASPAYQEEAHLLSACSAMETEELQSLEMRIMPYSSSREAIKEIALLDRCIIAQQRRSAKCSVKAYPALPDDSYKTEAQNQDRFFYVFHFRKRPLEPLRKMPYDLRDVPPRNAPVRAEARKQARALAGALERSSYLCSRVRGIDAASHEIGCRPEVFGPVFRYLRGFVPRGSHIYEGPRYWPLLGITYHVGEDFLELADGLRAIDEAVFFLNMENGDRLGHALALGIDPRRYSRLKGDTVLLAGQDLLDNIVWLLFRSQEWGIRVPPDLYAKMRNRATSLLRQIYGKNNPDATLDDYYESWQLRGDDPELYRKIAGAEEFESKLELQQCALLDPYQAFLIHWGPPETKNLSNLRKKDAVRRLLHFYHFGREERRLGQELLSWERSDGYLQLIADMQDCMMEKLSEKGISVECNPSSNKLIGAFEQYEDHPLFRFNRRGLPEGCFPHTATQLKISVNTDDLGVFDTSLENEYVLLYGTLLRYARTHQLPELRQDVICDYLDSLRQMGNGMVFPKSKPMLQTRLRNHP